MSNRNSLIDDDSTYQTLHNASCVIRYLQALAPVDEGELMGEDAIYGQYMLLACIRDALDHEKGRVLTMRKAAHKETDA